MELGTSNTHAVDFIAAAGVPIPWSRVFLQSQPWSANAYKPVTDANARGQKVILSNKIPAGATMATIANYDSFFNGIFAGLAAAGVQNGIYVFYHEPEDNVQNGEFTAAQWRAAQAHIAALVHASPLVGWRFGTVLMEYTLTPQSGRDPENYYVPTADILLWDAYNGVDTHEPGKPYCTTDPSAVPPGVVLQPVIDYCAAKGKPYGYAEFGCARQMADSTGVKRTAWLQHLQRSRLMATPEMCCYFDMGIPEGFTEWAIRAEPDRRGDAQIARRLGGRVGEERLGGRELAHDLARRAEQHLPLLGEHETARVAVEERNLQLLLQRGHLAADRRLAHAQRLTGMGEAAGLGGGMKDAELIPVHGGLCFERGGV
jgi:hypothetical protein